jgi:RNA 3'-terminal phosphate cyclase (ATP)
MLHIDASTLEGGGQLPRLALCLSALTLTPVHLTGIRANRALPTYSKKRKTAPPKPGKDGGLKESHLAALQFLADATDAKVTGDEVGSRQVVFKPRKDWCLGADMGISEAVRIELKNPGSVLLIFQALFPYIVFAKRLSVALKGKEDKAEAEQQWFELVLCGGTNVDKSMSLEYMQQVFAPVCRKIGLPEVRIECERRGWAGAVGEVGEVKISIDVPEGKHGEKGFTMDAFQIDDRGEVQRVVINVLAHSEEVRVTVIAKTKERLLASLGDDLKIEVEVDEDSHHDSRFYILLVAHTSNGWRLGRDKERERARRQGRQSSRRGNV